ncbi:MAG: ATP-binding cassette domain-containing protein [Bacteroidales bacterium]|nr:ATP-binding cassette domain-containing protein [Bacteroidales bacterium]
MSESILNALIHLFAIVANIRAKDITQEEKDIVKAYLERFINQELLEEYLRVFDNYFEFYQRELREDSDTPVESYSLISFQITNVCRQIKGELLREERIVVFIQLLEFIWSDREITDGEIRFIKTVADTFNISESEYNNCKAFIFEGKPDNIDKDRVLIVDNQVREWSQSMYWMMKKKTREIHSYPYKHIYKENLYGQMLFLHLESIDTFVFRYFGQLNLFIEGHRIVPGHSYFFKSGSIIKGPNIEPIYFHDVVSRFLEERTPNRLVFNTYDITFTFPNSYNGVRTFNVSEESGQLIGVMGGSGVGKSTLLNVLNGKIPQDEGKITVNGYNIHSESEELKGLIGHVPQDDLLIEELSVYQNLYYNAKLCFRDFTEKQIHRKVMETLDVLDLLDIRDLKVGNPMNKFISGGQRKRLNIGLELMREPYVMFIDEPTTGLSSMDSEKVMYLLKEQALKGKLLIVNIHQPSSEIYKLFDKMWILDRGGYPIYQGNPIDAVVYFKTVASQVNAAESECPHCGNVNPEKILKIVEARKVDDFGEPIKERKTPPETWFNRYREKIEKKVKRREIQGDLPRINFHIPNPFKQFRIFSMRNLLSKLSNQQYILLNLFEAPILAVVLSYFSKYMTEQGYIFAQNKNLPVFLFMSVVVALFMGLTISAEEIIKDRRILERESFLNLSWVSYLNSKIVYLFGLSALQTFTYVLISIHVLEIQDMLLPFWLILFSTSCFGNMIGLNISSGLNSVITIYILIPLILVPHLLLGGALINFDDLHKSITNTKHVPFIGNLMVTRWSYEALAVNQFKNNEFEKRFFSYDKQISEADYKTSFLIPELEAKLEVIQRNIANNENLDETRKDLRILRNELIKLQEDANKPPFEYLSLLNLQEFNEELVTALKDYLTYIRLHFLNLGREASRQRSREYDQMIQEHGIDWVRNLKSNHHNQRLAELLQNTNEVKKMYETDQEIIQKKDPIFMDPRSDMGLAHFYAPVKIIKGFAIDTHLFNLIIIWVGAAILYYLLVFNMLRRLLQWVDSFFSGITSFRPNQRKM